MHDIEPRPLVPFAAEGGGMASSSTADSAGRVRRYRYETLMAGIAFPSADRDNPLEYELHGNAAHVN